MHNLWFVTLQVNLAYVPRHMVYHGLWTKPEIGRSSDQVLNPGDCLKFQILRVIVAQREAEHSQKMSTQKGISGISCSKSLALGMTRLGPREVDSVPSAAEAILPFLKHHPTSFHQLSFPVTCGTAVFLFSQSTLAQEVLAPFWSRHFQRLSQRWKQGKQAPWEIRSHYV